MQLRTSIALAAGLFISASALAAPTLTYNRMNQLLGGITETSSSSANQKFEPSSATFSSFVADDAAGDAGTVNRMAVALVFNTAANAANAATAITGWEIFASDSLATLAAGGGLAATVGIANVTISVINNNSRWRLFEIAGLSIPVGGGTTWYGVRPAMSFSAHGQTFMLAGAGPSNNARFINPGNGFALGTSLSIPMSAAMAVNVNASPTTNAVPVPGTLALAMLAMGVAAAARRRRVQSA
jgi:MYXO-CTERM domain-containing protein